VDSRVLVLLDTINQRETEKGGTMGYRSDVAILIYGDKDDVTAFVAGEKLKGKPKDVDYHPLSEPNHDQYHESAVYDYYKDTKTMMRWLWWDTKWYDSYPEVDYWQNLRDVFDQSFDGTSLCMEVAIVGESVDDNTTDYYGSNPEYYLNISRAIEDSSPETLSNEPNSIRDAVDSVKDALEDMHKAIKGESNGNSSSSS
jgi:hypothetical protein